MFYDRFKALCDKQGISCNRAALEMGLSNATPTAWKKRGLTPKADTLAVIANYFDVSIDYLVGEETKNEPTANNGDELTGDLTDEQRQLIALFDSAPQSLRDAALAVLRAAEVADKDSGKV